MVAEDFQQDERVTPGYTDRTTADKINPRWGWEKSGYLHCK